MKIEKNQIRVSAQTTSLDILKNLKEGSRLSVKITEKINNTNAVLDIAGKKVNAEFLQGVPDSSKLFLVLDSKAKDTLFFRIADSSYNNVIQELNEFNVFNIKDLNKSIYQLRLLLKDGIISIFAFNKSLLRFTGHTETKVNSRSITSLFNLLLSKGANYENLLLIAALINAGKNPAIIRFYNIMAAFLPNKYTPEFNDINKTAEEFDQFYDLLIESISDENKEIVEENKKAISEIINNIINDTGEEKNNYGEIIFFDENKFKICGFIINENNIILSLNLSNLGDIDIIIKQQKTSYLISFFSTNNDSITKLKSGISELESSISLYDNKKVHITFYNSTKAVEKIIEIISIMDFNYLIDVKA